MCGLKHCVILILKLELTVTPHVGVWIETLKCARLSATYLVTPHVGVWIETTKVNSLGDDAAESHLM